ncbi:MAG: F0F1 ATP synthase subunit A, partial [Alphaproteobacteria bacterium]|nr:F0F1 ATP synthase subunit A [Alphaproteobacteria bacterium]
MALHSPIEQFEIHAISEPLFTLAGQPIAFTNSTLGMFLALFFATIFFTLPMRSQAIIPGRWQMLVETFYNGVSTMVSEAAGEKARPFFPFIFTLFMFIMFCNLLGLFPHVYTVTSQLVVNFALALIVIGVVLVTGFVKHGFHFFHLFVPPGVPG